MKRLLFIPFFITGLLFGGNYTTNEASNHIGENSTVCGTVSSGHYARSTRGKPTFINLDGSYPNQTFTIVIWGSDRDQFGSPERKYNGKKICVTGIIDSYRSVPQIVVTDKSQLK